MLILYFWYLHKSDLPIGNCDLTIKCMLMFFGELGGGGGNENEYPYSQSIVKTGNRIEEYLYSK